MNSLMPTALRMVKSCFHSIVAHPRSVREISWLSAGSLDESSGLAELPGGGSSRPIGRLFKCVACLLFTASFSVAEDPLDWPFWRGPEYNGVSRETGLIGDWDPDGGPSSHVLWQRDDLGSRGTPIVMNGRLYSLQRADAGTPTEGERVVCVDAASGQNIWERRFNVYLSDVPDTRVGWSSCLGDPETGYVYALGVCGVFQCLDGVTGEVIWALPLHERFGLLSTYGGRTNFPVICDDLVIISAIVIGWGEMAKPAHQFVGFNKRTGEVVWFKGTTPLPYDTTYSSPTVTVLDGQKALVFGSGDGAVWAVQPRTGNPIWNFRLSRRGLNVSPLVVDDLVVVSHSEENIDTTEMGSVVVIDPSGQTGDITDSGELWREYEMMAGKSSPIAVDGQLFIIDDRAKLYSMELETGEPIGDRISLGTVMRSSPLFADGKIYTITQNGRWYILEADPVQGASVLSEGRLIGGDESHASPICSHGKIYIQTTGRLYCLGDLDQSSSADDRPEAPFEEDVETDREPVYLQVVPAEVLLSPGDIQVFTATTFNSRGQRLDEVSARFRLEGSGTIDSAGRFTAATAGHSATKVFAEFDGLVGSARIRTVAPLPWKFDFEDIALNPATQLGEPPVTWVGARYRHVVRREPDGNQTMVKITTIPKGARSRCWFGHPETSNYTIQADVRGSLKNNKMPDIGLIAQGYTLDLQGANQALQIRSWVPQRRMASTNDFPWQADCWYTMKFRAEVIGGQASLRGKVWPRDEDEPENWSVEATDSSPNLSGSPGLFGNAKNAEIFLDNIRVTEN